MGTKASTLRVDEDNWELEQPIYIPAMSVFFRGNLWIRHSKNQELFERCHVLITDERFLVCKTRPIFVEDEIFASHSAFIVAPASAVIEYEHQHVKSVSPCSEAFLAAFSRGICLTITQAVEQQESDGLPSFATQRTLRRFSSEPISKRRSPIFQRASAFMNLPGKKDAMKDQITSTVVLIAETASEAQELESTLELLLPCCDLSTTPELVSQSSVLW